MTRSTRILLGVAALILVLAASAVAAPARPTPADPPVAAASRQPQADDAADKGPPSAEQVDRLVERLTEAGITADAAALEDLAAGQGVGGAVRILAWADAAGLDPAEIVALRESGLGWGEIVRQLNEANEDLDLHPGIGTVMSNGHGGGQANDGEKPGNGLGRDGAPGQQKKP